MTSALIGKTPVDFLDQVLGENHGLAERPSKQGGCWDPNSLRLVLWVVSSANQHGRGWWWWWQRALHCSGLDLMSSTVLQGDVVVWEPVSRKAVPRSRTWREIFPLAVIVPASTMGVSAWRFIKSCLYQWSGPTHGVGLGETNLGLSFSKCWKN